MAKKVPFLLYAMMMVMLGLFSTGCGRGTVTRYPLQYQVHIHSYWDSTPSEGWATDPILSYRLYSYYPMDFNHGGFYEPYYYR